MSINMDKRNPYAEYFSQTEGDLLSRVKNVITHFQTRWNLSEEDLEYLHEAIDNSDTPEEIIDCLELIEGTSQAFRQAKSALAAGVRRANYRAPDADQEIGNLKDLDDDERY